MRVAASLLLSMLSCTALHATAISHPTFILVHGALMDSTVWTAVQSQLQNAGYNVLTMDVPGRADDGIPARDVTLESAAAKLCKVADMQVGAVIVVGHSESGAVITQALDQCAYKIKSLVYLAAVAPLPGEKTFDDLSQQDNDNFDKCVTLSKDRSVMNVNEQAPLKAMFMADATDGQAQRAIHNMVAEPVALANATLHYPLSVFRAKPKFYIETSNDLIIAPATQQKIENKIQPRSIFILNSSHSPFVSQPKQVADALINISNLVKEGS